jgi:hypothetical protein
MSYNGSGTFQINTAGQPVVTGTIISSTAFNSLTADLATGLSTAITKDGQTTTTARIIFAQGTRDDTLTASSAVATDASKNLVSVTNTGTGNNVLATSPTLVTPILGTPTSGNLINCTGINYDGYKNRLINGQMQVAQRGTSGTSGAAVPTTAPTYPSVDRWYAYATGATVTVAQVAGTGAIKNNLQVTGAASVTAVGVGQRIEQLNCYDLAGSTCTLSVNISNSLLTTVTWTASYATSANTWSAKTQIATGTFTVTSTLTNYSAQISVSAAATTGIEILFTVGAQTSGTWVIGNAQLEKSSIATTFDYRPYGTELALCQRYYYRTNGTVNLPRLATGFSDSTTTANFIISFPVTMRTIPTALEQSGTATDYNLAYSGTNANCSLVPAIIVCTVNTGAFIYTVAAVLTLGQGVQARLNTNGYLGWSAEL